MSFVDPSEFISQAPAMARPRDALLLPFQTVGFGFLYIDHVATHGVQPDEGSSVAAIPSGAPKMLAEPTGSPSFWSATPVGSCHQALIDRGNRLAEISNSLGNISTGFVIGGLTTMRAGALKN